MTNFIMKTTNAFNLSILQFMFLNLNVIVSYCADPPVEKDSCNPSPCGPNSQCREINDHAVCSCVPGYIGNPPFCQPECIISSECSLNLACTNQKCMNPCLGSCGVGARCTVINHNPICSCPERYTGDPYTRCQPMIIPPSTPRPNPCQSSPCGSNANCRVIRDNAVCSCLPNMIGTPPNCRMECISNSQCPFNLACVSQNCQDPCPGICGFNADCSVVNHNPICSCKKGFAGDPFAQCKEVLQDISQEFLQPCSPNPCGSNAVCREQNSADSCVCLPEYIGNPYEGCRRPECVRHRDCPSKRACLRYKCTDPCPGTCTENNADCSVVNHIPVCSCKKGFSGDPFIECTEVRQDIPTTQAQTVTVEIPEDACLVPQFPKNGRFVQDIRKPFDNIVQPKEIITNYSPITVVCDTNYTLTGVDTITCVSGEWDSDFPTCIAEKFCSGMAINGLTVTPKCLLNRKEISCKKLIPLRTKVEISCKLGYGTPDKVVQTLYCVDGSWSAEVIKCSPDCGTFTQKGESYISGGVDANVAEVPWHAGIYSNRTTKWNQICGGTILTEKIVLSAAHCFWNIEERKFYEAKNYKMGFGKFYRNYTAVEHYPVQFVDIKEIITNERYRHLEGLFNFDIAIIISKNYIIFMNHIRPICLNRGAKTSMERTVQPNKVGIVAGWGYTENDEIAVNLKVANITSTDFNTCYTRALESYKPFVVVGDKFCAGSPVRAVSVCRGDSGGGLVFRESLNGEGRYFIRGIVSSGQLALEKICDSKQYVLFTNVLDYLEMIDETEKKVIFSEGESEVEAK